MKRLPKAERRGGFTQGNGDPPDFGQGEESHEANLVNVGEGKVKSPRRKQGET